MLNQVTEVLHTVVTMNTVQCRQALLSAHAIGGDGLPDVKHLTF